MAKRGAKRGTAGPGELGRPHIAVQERGDALVARDAARGELEDTGVRVADGHLDPMDIVLGEDFDAAEVIDAIGGAARDGHRNAGRGGGGASRVGTGERLIDAHVVGVAAEVDDALAGSLRLGAKVGDEVAVTGYGVALAGFEVALKGVGLGENGDTFDLVVGGGHCESLIEPCHVGGVAGRVLGVGGIDEEAGGAIAVVVGTGLMKRDEEDDP